MVRVTAMLAGVALAACGSAAAASSSSSFDALPAFAIPAFDYPTIGAADAPERLLQALQSDGIVALRNVPNYANARAQYLQRAAECAVAAADDAANGGGFVSQKQFADGTKRLTISTNAGLELAGSAAKTQAKCPGYQELYEEFSQILERAVNTFGSTLDATSFRASDGAAAITSRKLVREAIRLDHFHAYEASAAASSTAVDQQQNQRRELAFSLPLHEDHGLFIAMSAPKFFEVQQDGASATSTSDGARRLVERQLAADRSGLVIQTAAGQRVRPVLHEDEVVIMMGTGASRWLQTSHALPAVLHGMKMPESLVGDAGRRTLRAWFGKMTLLPAYQRMLQNRDVVFDAVVNSTARHLMETIQDTDDLKTVGCAPGRRLQASANSCVVKTCKAKAGKAEPSEKCAVVCNRNHGAEDAKECAVKCECTTGGAGEVCWMLCVASLPTDQCPKSSQVCAGQEVKCNAPVTPAPGTVAPTTVAPSPTTVIPPAPSSVAPATTAPPTVAPATTTPATAAPSTKTPSSTDTPDTKAPTTPAPGTKVPSTDAPSTKTPSTAKPNTPTPSGGNDDSDGSDDSDNSDSWDSIDDSSDSWDSFEPVPSPSTSTPKPSGTTIPTTVTPQDTSGATPAPKPSTPSTVSPKPAPSTSTPQTPSSTAGTVKPADTSTTPMQSAPQPSSSKEPQKVDSQSNTTPAPSPTSGVSAVSVLSTSVLVAAAFAQVVVA